MQLLPGALVHLFPEEDVLTLEVIVTQAQAVDVLQSLPHLSSGILTNACCLNSISNW